MPQHPLPGCLQPETLTYRNLLLKKANSYPCAIYNKCTEVPVCCEIGKLHLRTHILLYPRFWHVCLSFLYSLDTPVSFLGPCCTGCISKQYYQMSSFKILSVTLKKNLLLRKKKGEPSSCQGFQCSLCTVCLMVTFELLVKTVGNSCISHVSSLTIYPCKEKEL